MDPAAPLSPAFLCAEELRQYRDLFRLAPIGIVRTSPAGRIQDGNQAFATILGYDDFDELCQATGNSILALYPDPAQRGDLLARLAALERPRPEEIRWRKKDGSLCHCRLQVRLARGPGGEILHLEAFVEDVTRRKLAEEALALSVDRYRSVFENTGTATIIIEPDTTVSLANESFAALTGYSKEEIEGRMRWTAFIARSDDLDRMLRYHRARRNDQGGAPIEYEFTLRDKAGNLKDVFLRVDMIAGSSASVASLLDITSLKAARRFHLESSSRLSGILEAFDGFLYISSADHRILYLNNKQQAAQAETAESAPCHRRLYGLAEPCPWCADGRVFAGETVKYEFRNPHNGRWYYAVGAPVYQGENDIGGQQTVLLDIHERKIAEEALRQRESSLAEENLRLKENIGDRYRFGRLIGRSPAMQKVYELILRAAAGDANVILYGESGTGKELVAQAIHEMSDRRRQAFVAVNCAAIPPALMESEFFGYCRGAFTGADKDKPGLFDRANGGTLFLDELGEIDEAMQAKLLRVLESNGYPPLGGVRGRQADVRIIAATNCNLGRLLDEGRMREDFFYRIHVIPITLPPLRQRRQDIPLLVEHFLAKYATSESPPRLVGRDMDRLLAHHWPGNVRELENTIQRYLNLHILEFPGGAGPVPSPSPETLLPLRQANKRFERDYLLEVLGRCHWNRTQAARQLGIERKTLYLKMREFDLLRPPHE